MDPFFEKNLISTKEAGELSGYNADYLSRLARSGKISGRRVGRAWLVDRASLDRFLSGQEERKNELARSLAHARTQEYRAAHSPLYRVREALARPLTSAQKSTQKITPASSRFVVRVRPAHALRTHALALLVALLVVSSGALAARAAFLPSLFARAARAASDAALGFHSALDDASAALALRLAGAEESANISAASAARTIAAATAPRAPAALALPDLSAYPLALAAEPSASEPVRGAVAAAPAPLVPADALAALRFAQTVIAAAPAELPRAALAAYLGAGESGYAAIRGVFSGYHGLIDAAGAGALAQGAQLRDLLAQSPRAIAEMNLALGNAIIAGSRAAIGADIAIAQAPSRIAPAAARPIVVLLGGAGVRLASLAAAAPRALAGAYLDAAAFPAHAAPALARAVFGVEYAAARVFVASTDHAARGYLAALQGTGSASYEGAHAAGAALAGIPSLRAEGAALEDYALGALGRTALALARVAASLRFPGATAPLAAALEALPGLSLGERAALTTYETINNWFVHASGALAELITPPTIVLPSVPRHAPAAAATSTPARVVESHPTYTTVVRGVSEGDLQSSLALLRADVMSQVGLIFSSIPTQIASNNTTLARSIIFQAATPVNVVNSSDIQNSNFFNGKTVSSNSGQFTLLSSTGTTTLGATSVSGAFSASGAGSIGGDLSVGGALSVSGTTTLATTTIRGDLSVSGTITPAVISAGASISAPYFAATSSSATSTFAGSLAIGGNGFVYATSTRNVGIGVLSPAALLALRNATGTQPIFLASNATGTEAFRITDKGFVGIGSSTPGYALSVEGSSSLGSEARAGFFTATSSAATSTFAGTLSVGSSTPFSNALFAAGTTTSPFLFVHSTTGRIGIGTSSPAVALDLFATDALRLPVGTTLQRPAIGGVGFVRYNTTTHQFEGFGDNSVWQGLGGVINAAQTTYITASDTNFLHFVTNGVERLTIDPNGLIGVASTSPFAAFAIHLPASASTTIAFAIASSTASATSTLFQVTNTGNTSVAGALTALGQTLAPYFTATSATASVFPNASTTLASVANGLYNTYLTANRIPYTTTNGLLTDSASLIFNGTNFGIGTTSPAATLSVAGSGYLTGGLGVGAVNTTAGTLQTSGAASVGGAFSASGAATLSSTLAVAGNTTLAAASSTALFSSGGLSALGSLAVGSAATSTIAGDYGASSIRGALTVFGNTPVGSASTLAIQRGSTNGDNALVFNDQTGATLLKLSTSANSGHAILSGFQSFLDLGTSFAGTALSIDTSSNVNVTSHLVPTANALYNLGSPARYWSNAYLNNIVANNLSSASTSIAGTNNTSFSIDSNNPTADAQDISLIFFRGAGAPSNAVLSWNSLLKRFEFNQNARITNASASTGSTTLQVAAVAGQTAPLTSWLDSAGNTLGTFTAAGSVGIGTSSPFAALSVFAGGDFAAHAASTLFAVGSSTAGTATSTFFVVNSAGNIGIGTTSPAATLSVAGSGYLTGGLGVGVLNTAAGTFQTSGNAVVGGSLTVSGLCVTGDTKLRRRRRRKDGEEPDFEEGETADDNYIYDEIAIKDIREGDEIQSLDEKTGALVWRRVKRLAFMGKKRTFRLATASGSSIRTTANHPYLARRTKNSDYSAGAELAAIIAFVDYANIKAWARSRNAAINLEVLKALLASVGISRASLYYGADPDNRGVANFLGKLRTLGYEVVSKPLQYFRVTLSELFNQSANKRWLDALQAEARKYLIEEARRLDDARHSFLTPKANFDVEITMDALRQVNNFNHLVLFSGDGDFTPLISHLRALGKDTTAISGKEFMSSALHATARTAAKLENLVKIVPELIYPLGADGSYKKPTPAHEERVWENCSASIAALLGLSSSSAQSVDNVAEAGEGSWLKVTQLKEGMEIAVVPREEYGAAARGRAVWERVVSVEAVAEEEVWDIEIEGTHNFVGNGIVAHNTAFFNQASTTQLSVTQKAYFGGTATTTIDSAGSIVLPAAASLTLGALNGPLQANAGVVSATTSVGVLYGGTGWAAIQAGSIPYGNGAGALATTTAGAAGNVLAILGGVPTWTATTTFSSGLAYAAGNVTNTGLLSLAQTFGTPQTGAITLATSTQSFNGLTLGSSITNAGGAFTFTPSFSGTLNNSGLTNSTIALALGASGADANVSGSPAALGGTVTLNLPTASAVNRGLLSSADWTTFNNKVSSTSLSASFPLAYNSGTGAFTFGGLSTSTAAVVGNIPYFSSANQFANVATTSIALGTGLSYSGTLGSLVGGAGGTLSLSGVSPSSISLAKGNFLVGNDAGAAQATSTIFISSTGNIGIGTTSPAARLTIQDGGANVLTINNTSGIEKWRIPSLGAVGGTDSLDFTAAGVANGILHLERNGNVGIGTTTPNRTLDVYGALQSESSQKTNVVINPNAYAYGAIYGLTDQGATTNLLINPVGGNVGIGTTTPATVLSVYTSGTWAGAFQGITGGAVALGSVSGVPTVQGATSGSVNAVTTLSLNPNGGNVGIGTTTPSVPLTFAQTTGDKIRLYDGGDQYGFGVYGNELRLFGGSGAATTFGTQINGAFTERMRLTSAGNLGIGTTTPASALQVQGSITIPTASKYYFTINGAIPDTNWSLGYNVGPGGNFVSTAGIVETVFNGAGFGHILKNTSGTSLFEVQGSDGKAYFAGNVGIGTTTPAAKLDVNGIFRTEASNAPYFSIGGDAGVNRIQTNGATAPSIQFLNTTNQYANIGAGALSVGGTYATVAAPANGAIIEGNVGIGTTGPGRKLQVTGNGIRLTDAAQNTQADIIPGTVNGQLDFESFYTTGSFLTFGTNSNGGGVSERMRIDSSGNVGIGTTTPIAQLDVENASGPANLILNDRSVVETSGLYNIRSSAGDLIFYQGRLGVSANATFKVNGSGSTSFGISVQNLSAGNFTGTNLTSFPVNGNNFINNGGNVGIGTTNPGTIGGDGGTFTALNVNKAGGYGLLTLSTDGTADGTTGGAVTFGSTGAGSADKRFAVIAGVSNGSSAVTTNGMLQFYTNNAGTIGERMRITSVGNVGIGTTNPGSRLSVQQSSDPTLGNDGTGAIRIYNTAGTSFGQLQVNTSGIELSSSGSTILPLFLNVARSGTPPVTISTSGNVGIGTTSPWRTLSVTGTVGFDGLTTSAATQADYLCLSSNKEVIADTGTCLASSQRFKQDIVPLSYSSGLAEVMALDPVSFFYKPSFNGALQSNPNFNGEQVGFIAEEVQKVDPRLVTLESDGTTPHGVRYENVTAVLARALQDIQRGYTLNALGNGATSTLASRYAGTTTPAISVDTAGNVGIGLTDPKNALQVAGEVGAIGFVNTSTRDAKTDITYLSPEEASSTLAKLEELKPATYLYKIEGAGDAPRLGVIAEDAAQVAPEILSADQKGVDLYKLATFTLTGVQELALRQVALSARVDSLEARIKKLEDGSITVASASPISFSTSTLAGALNDLGILVQKGIAQFNTLVFRQLVASKDADGTSSAGSVSLIAGNTVAQVSNSLVKPSTKIFITFGAPVVGSWWVSDKTVGSFRVVLSAPQAADVSFDYFLVQTEGQLATSTPEGSFGGGGAAPAAGAAGGSSGGSDTTAPVITLLGDNPVHISVGGTYAEPGLSITDDRDGTIGTYKTFVNGVAFAGSLSALDTSASTTYTITYQAADSAGNSATALRTVIVGGPGASTAPSSTAGASGAPAINGPADTAPPVVILNDAPAIMIGVGDRFSDPGATAMDDVDGDMTAKIVVSGSVDTATAGLYTLTYSATDKAGNTGSVSRVVTVQDPKARLGGATTSTTTTSTTTSTTAATSTDTSASTTAAI